MEDNLIKNIQSKQFDVAGQQVKELLAAKLLDTISDKRVEIGKGFIGEGKMKNAQIAAMDAVTAKKRAERKAKAKASADRPTSRQPIQDR